MKDGIDVHQDWSGSGVENRGDTGHEGEGDRYDFIAGTDTRSQESQVQRACPRVYGNTLGGLAIGPEISFEVGDVRSQDELTSSRTRAIGSSISRLMFLYWALRSR